MRHIELLTTGGTIEKVYDEAAGTLVNRGSIVQRMIRRLRLEDTRINIREILAKDSLYITDDERAKIVDEVRRTLAGSPKPDGILILHGTDTLCQTGDLLHRELFLSSSPAPSGGGGRDYSGGEAGGGAAPGATACPEGQAVPIDHTQSPKPASPQAGLIPIILTGAMRPYEMKRSDALQNLTEAIFATRVMPPGVYVAAHGRVLKFPGVVKDRQRGTFATTSHA